MAQTETIPGEKTTMSRLMAYGSTAAGVIGAIIIFSHPVITLAAAVIGGIGSYWVNPEKTTSTVKGFFSHMKSALGVVGRDIGALAGVVDKAIVEKAKQSPVEADKGGHGLSTAQSATSFNNEAAPKKDAVATTAVATPAAKAPAPKV
jgi:hypothetical protein